MREFLRERLCVRMVYKTETTIGRFRVYDRERKREGDRESV